ncbi:hypothetical protein BUALT_Bualt18G0051900 [Buddleja alternifolia]|uniref:E3 ubiquitin-protein ligase RMA n=1 Tax=Buddleja alternifolia TaxID=168488 RepID=A0AAV6WD63_9LAMI|nr:hypothetical protein BUALT_Bualt18G0051900 [Buddleja alternifolia]
MASQHDTPTVHFQSQGDFSHEQKWNAISHSATQPENLSGSFDCNICLDSSHDPVVTLCGHLYCWPCIYKWLNVQNSSLEQPKCPVCKSYISPSSLVPLYGRGTSPSESQTKKPELDLAIPHRPLPLELNTIPNQQNPFHQVSNYTSITPPTFGGTTTTSLTSPTINMVGEMVFATMFGGSDTNLFAYPYSNSYPFPGNVSPRFRRQEMQLDKSLNRVSIFLFCCIVLCLILF